MKAAMILGALALVAATGPASTWTGHYRGREPHLYGPNHADQYLDVTALRGGRMKLAFTLVSPSCANDLSFVTRQTAAPRLVLSKASGGGLCVLRVEKAGGRILVSEQGCEGERGMQCSFAGVYRR